MLKVDETFLQFVARCPYHPVKRCIGPLKEWHETTEYVFCTANSSRECSESTCPRLELEIETKLKEEEEQQKIDDNSQFGVGA